MDKNAELMATTSSTSNQSLSVNTRDEGCMDIKEYLWNTTHDLTSLPSTMSIFLCLYSLIIVLGVLGNLLVITSVIRHKALQSVRNVFIVSLSFSDIIVSLVSGTVTPVSAFSKVWLFGGALCRLVPLIQGSSLCFSTLTLTAIAIDRFILIIYPTKRSIQTRHAMYMIGVNYIIATCVSLPMFLQQRLVDYENFCGKFCTEEWSNNSARSTYGTIVFISQFVLPILIITFCYSMISIRLAKGMLVKGGKSEEQKLTAKSDQRKSALKRRIRTNRMLVSMVLVFLVCWSPSVAFNFLRDYEWLPGFVNDQGYLFGLITHLISISSTVWNPLLYTMLNEQFRLAFAEYFRPCRGKSKSKIISGGTNQDVESVASIMQPKMSRLGSRLSERCSNLISGVILDMKGRNPHVVRNSNVVNMSPRTTHSSLPRIRSGTLTEQESSRDSAQWTSKLIDDTNNMEDSQI